MYRGTLGRDVASSLFWLSRRGECNDKATTLLLRRIQLLVQLEFPEAGVTAVCYAVANPVERQTLLSNVTPLVPIHLRKWSPRYDPGHDRL